MYDLQFIFRYNYSMNPSLQGKKALVIDNSSIITKIIKNFLVQTGFEKDNIFRNSSERPEEFWNGYSLSISWEFLSAESSPTEVWEALSF